MNAEEHQLSRTMASSKLAGKGPRPTLEVGSLFNTSEDSHVDDTPSK